jgi:hypothetical protein
MIDDSKWRMHERRPRKRGIEEIKKYSDELTELFRNKVGEDLDLILFEKSKSLSMDGHPFLAVLKHGTNMLHYKGIARREEADELLVAMNASMSLYILGITNKVEMVDEIVEMMR